MGRLIPAGTGLAYHEERKKAKQEKMAEKGQTIVSASEVEQALSEALSNGS